MAGPLVPRRRVLPELLSVLIVYGLISLGAFAFALSVLSGSPNFPDLYERLPVALLALLPAALLVILPPGAYTVQVTSQSNATGVALVEVYDASEGTP